MFNLGLHIQTNLIVSKWNEVISHVQVFKNFTSLYILLESYWRIYKLSVYAKTDEDRNPEMWKHSRATATQQDQRMDLDCRGAEVIPEKHKNEPHGLRHKENIIDGHKWGRNENALGNTNYNLK